MRTASNVTHESEDTMTTMGFRGLVEGTSERGRVVVVDDDPELRRGVARVLTQAGYRVEVAASAEEADQWLSDQRFEVCVLDIGLPGMSGLGFLDWAHVRDPEMAVIMLTAIDAPEITASCLDKGARGLLTKPVDVSLLLRAVRDAMAVRRLLVSFNHEHGHGESAGKATWRASC